MLLRTLLALLAVAPLAEAGSNGMAMTPPLTWRSWNQYASLHSLPAHHCPVCAVRKARGGNAS